YEPCYGSKKTRDRIRVLLPERAYKVLATNHRHRSEGRRANYRQLGPAEQEGHEPSKALAKIDKHTSGVRQTGGELGNRTPPTKREAASEKPKREVKSFAGNFCCDARGRPEDPAADRRADQHRGCAEQTQPALQRQPSHSCRGRFIRMLNQASPGYKLRELI